MAALNRSGSSTLAVQKDLRAGLLAAVKGIRCDRVLFVVRERRRVLPPPARLFLAFLEANAVITPMP